jgi:hypothetical protein
MFTFRDIILFIAGAEFFNTLTHILVWHGVNLPFHAQLLIHTPEMPALNVQGILVHGIITLALLFWTTRLPRK